MLGGIICDRTTWRWIFLLNVPCGGVVLFVILLAWSDSVDKRSLSLHQVSLAQIDYVGTLLLMAATVLLIVALQEAGTATIPMDSSVIICLLAAAGVSALGLVGWIRFLENSKYNTLITPTFPSRFLKQRVMCMAFL